MKGMSFWKDSKCLIQRNDDFIDSDLINFTDSILHSTSLNKLYGNKMANCIFWNINNASDFEL